MTQDEILLFANEKAFDAAVRTSLEKDGVVLKPYNDIYQYVKTVPENRTVLLSRKSANSRLVSSLPESVKVLDEEILPFFQKAIKIRLRWKTSASPISKTA